MLRFVSVFLARACDVALASLALTLAAGLFIAAPAAAQHKMNENDMELPTNDAAVGQLGKDKFAQRCSFCHGGGGEGGEGPRLPRGRVPESGATQTQHLYPY